MGIASPYLGFAGTTLPSRRRFEPSCAAGAFFEWKHENQLAKVVRHSGLRWKSKIDHEHNNLVNSRIKALVELAKASPNKDFQELRTRNHVLDEITKTEAPATATTLNLAEIAYPFVSILTATLASPSTLTGSPLADPICEQNGGAGKVLFEHHCRCLHLHLA